MNSFQKRSLHMMQTYCFYVLWSSLSMIITVNLWMILYVWVSYIKLAGGSLHVCSNQSMMYVLHRNQCDHVSEIKPQVCEISSCCSHSSVTAEYTAFPLMEVCYSSVVTGNVSKIYQDEKVHFLLDMCYSVVSKFCPYLVCKCQTVLSGSIGGNLRERWEREREREREEEEENET